MMNRFRLWKVMILQKSWMNERLKHLYLARGYEADEKKTLILV